MTERAAAEIRKAKAEDFNGIMSVIKSNSGTFSRREIREAGRFIRESANPGREFFVAKASGRTVGCAGFSKREDTDGAYNLTWLAVSPEFKRLGVATSLYRLIESRIRKSGGRLILLNAGSGEENRYFYRKMGFRRTGRIPGYYRNGRSEKKDLLWYYKILT